MAGKPVVPRRTRVITDEIRAHVEQLGRDGMGRNEICRQTGLSAGTVTGICREAVPPIEFDRSQTKVAVEARRVDLAAMRADLEYSYMVKAQALLDQMDEEHIAFSFGGKDNTYAEKRMERPPVNDLRALSQASSTLSTAALRIAGAVLEDNVDDDRRMLIQIRQALSKGGHRDGLDDGLGLDDQAGGDDPEG